MRTLFNFAFLISISSCANYSTNTDITFNSVEIPEHDQSIMVLPAEIPNKEYIKMGEIEAVVNNRNRRAQGPTHDQANYVLRTLAKEKGADAVVNVKYDYDLPFFAFWNYSQLTATGELVKFKKTKSK